MRRKDMIYYVSGQNSDLIGIKERKRERKIEANPFIHYYVIRFRAIFYTPFFGINTIFLKIKIQKILKSF